MVLDVISFLARNADNNRRARVVGRNQSLDVLKTPCVSLDHAESGSQSVSVIAVASSR